jgi:hypothetical protein
MGSINLNLATNQSIQLNLLVNNPIYTIRSGRYVSTVSTSERSFCVVSIPTSMYWHDCFAIESINRRLFHIHNDLFTTSNLDLTKHSVTLIVNLL